MVNIVSLVKQIYKKVLKQKQMFFKKHNIKQIVLWKQVQ